MKKILLGLSLSVTVAMASSPHAAPAHATPHSVKSPTSNLEFEIKSYRFNHHENLNFERLVLEFKTKGHLAQIPSVRAVPSSSGKETVIHVGKIVLVGAIPEASINDSYTRKSSFIGPVSLNTDTGSGFSIRTFL